MTVEAKRLTDEQFGNLSRLLAGEALMRIEEMRQEMRETAAKLMTESSENELRLELEHERQDNLKHGETIARLRADNADLLKRLQALGPKR